MTGDEIPVARCDPFNGECYEFKDPRQITKKGYACPISEGVIWLCHDAALLADTLLLWEDPDATVPPLPDEMMFGSYGFEIVA